MPQSFGPPTRRGRPSDYACEGRNYIARGLFILKSKVDNRLQKVDSCGLEPVVRVDDTKLWENVTSCTEWVQKGFRSLLVDAENPDRGVHT